MPISLLPHRGILQVTGEDRCAFLQGLVTNDVTQATETRAIYAALLTAQGRYLHDFFILARGDALFIEGERPRLPDLAERLQRYRLRARVTVALLPDWQVGASWQAPQALLPAQAPQALLPAGLWHYPDPRMASLGLRFIGCPVPDFEDAGAAAYDLHRLQLGVPDGSRDLVAEKSLILENGLDALHAIDWTKGCYVGQELTARINYRGLLKKRLFPVRIEGEAPAPGTIIMAAGQEVGELRSHCGGHGLALLRLEIATQTEPVALVAGGATLMIAPVQGAADHARPS